VIMPVPRDRNPKLLQFARDMRKQPTDAEAKLWSILRGRTLAGFKFRRQYQIAGYILDFYCARCRVAVELDGGQHTDPDSIEYDRRRTEKLGEHGIRVIRFSDRDLLKETQLIAEEIFRQIEGQQARPQ
jgi:very-short-patch-repair endonuclease